ncbi:hypothetical protein Nepgr_003383 [Nepenthes gracilis]|uniref:mRNA export factor GLE1 n=1 Tax=Nepenthes gracilis TaxID=150966 RepID=A0AAD3XDH2_NEPGR|nr:hypothetical protein Nepgr_003383 [Nepenthes gracilis]
MVLGAAMAVFLKYQEGLTTLLNSKISPPCFFLLSSFLNNGIEDSSYQLAVKLESSQWWRLNWSFGVRKSKRNGCSSVPKFFNKARSREIWRTRRKDRGEKSFVMRVSDDEIDDFDGEDGKENTELSLVRASRFSFHDSYRSGSDDSEDEPAHQLYGPVIEKMGVVEGTLLEVTHQYRLGIKEEIRNQIFALETELVTANDKYASALAQVEKNAEMRREIDRKTDRQYQRKIAEALDNHLTAVQRDHEHRSQLEEKRIRDDAALEESRRKEKALQEEKLRKQKAKEEEEARLEASKRADEARKHALEAERRANEAAEKIAKENSMKAATATIAEHENQIDSTLGIQNVQSDGPKKVQSPVLGNIVRAAESALKLEERRLLKYKESDEKYQALLSSSNKGFVGYERQIGRRIKQISGSIENVRVKANELVKIFKDPLCPQSVSMMMFVKKVISIYENPNANFDTSAFACGRVIVLVSAQVPQVMDLLLAQFHTACIYTVPKHIIYSQSAFATKESYFKAIGYREEDGKMEEKDHYLERLRSCMKLYGALVQTQVEGFRNMHGLEEGWTWLARFLNALPANLYTAEALDAFLRMAGFALHRKYKSQFRKLLKAIARYFVTPLKARGGEPKLNSVINRLQDYIETKRFLVEPEGWRPPGSLLSRASNPDTIHQNEY